MKEEMKTQPIPGLDADGFHRTATIDYIMIVDGEVDLVLDQARTTVRAGDLVVQRNTNHAWHNNTDRPVDFWGVMVSVAAPRLMGLIRHADRLNKTVYRIILRVTFVRILTSG